MSSLQKIYETHHKEDRSTGFSILEDERGKLYGSILGTGKTVLDIGCRDGALTRHFSNGNKVLGVDIDSISLGRAKQTLGIETMLVDLNGDWQELAGRVFDGAVAGEVLEHLYYPERVVEKIILRLKPDGVFVGSVPNAFSLKNRIKYLFANKHFTPLEDPTHITQFSAHELNGMLRRHFSSVKIIGYGRLGVLARMCPELFAFDLSFVCKKPKHNASGSNNMRVPQI
ncbi:MAG: hypothetical protein A2633_01425 [Candidatus Sungbacteria bacterium RIFCSPHIGHO2_01_FULL_47_32]|uniref:Methyltransferase type 11 domain-containing protein n=1 Tax=Candidatus Sungbacteria bacterium RIFCSPHIGHO2_01_FULL_47_32 TaxID=1802264 RepID=A0A1G2K863_9BACT|nr:MAG: hypothetical protein A2633_01425 [Candidatus Sungbacteria bacterium RIFCSPHIGHO2_01_FULL_47_32]OGZ98168.1 MAG: hypothetical protein A3D57_03060 [Candidatus Sungbacteria bacterium RIFCSPHIGHO2_02_FULL_46_12]